MPLLSAWRLSWLSKRRLLPLLLGTAALALVWGRFAIQSQRAVGDAQSALLAGNRAEAVRAYEDALRVYVPGSPFEARALDGLRAMADDAHRDGDTLTERQALQAIRSGLLGTRSIVPPHRDRLAAASARLKAMDAAAGYAPPVELMVPRGHHGPGRLSDARGPAVLSTLIALIGLATWIAAVALLVRASIEDRAGPAVVPGGAGESAPPPVALPGGPLRVLLPVLFGVGVALFLIGLRVA